MDAPFPGGVWHYPSLAFPGHEDFMCIDVHRGRIVTFILMSVEPEKRAPVRLWFRAESAEAIAVQIRPGGKWNLSEFRYEEDQLVWIYDGGPHAWKRLAPHECPPWLEGRLEAANAKMDQQERGE